jgi:hypothetical protein
MISLDPETVAGLPIDQLSLLVLSDFVANDDWNERNYVLRASTQPGYEGLARQAIIEAFAWLRARGLTARDPTQNAPDTIFVTRTGLRVWTEGPDSFYTPPSDSNEACTP